MLTLLRQRRVLIGVVHLLATPGSPRYLGDRDAIVRHALNDARALIDGGCDALIVENFGDVPFHPREVPPETIATLALALSSVRALARDLPVGVNVLRNDARAALGLCAATGASFVRVNVHVGAAVTDQGVIEGRAHETLRERARLVPGVALLCDVHVKHATPLGDRSIGSLAADAARRGLADALIASGSSTGEPPSIADLRAVRRATPESPLLVGSGLTAQNARELLAHADGAIVGTWLKHGGEVAAAVDVERVRELRQAFDAVLGNAKSAT